MYHLLRPLLFSLDAERAHTLSFIGARLLQSTAAPMLKSHFGFQHDALRQRVWGIDFNNPIGVAAGLDKNARLIPFWQQIGFGFVEVGSVSAQPCEGNERPRAFRLPVDAAIINRMGLNNDGAKVIAKRLSKLGMLPKYPVGVNLAKTHDPAIEGDEAIADFRMSFRRLVPHARYVTLNISCPNTREGKTFEHPEALDALLSAILEERERVDEKLPVLVKLSPLLNERVSYDSAVEQILEVSQKHGVDGFVAANTASDREGLSTSKERLDEIGSGGLSGKPIEQRATHLVRYLYERTGGETPIIGVGGVHSAASAYRKIKAGASLVQLYTGLVYEGPGLIREIKEGLVELLQADGFENIDEAVGTEAESASLTDAP